jgi:hypothetical protein
MDSSAAIERMTDTMRRYGLMMALDVSIELKHSDLHLQKAVDRLAN